LPAAASTPLPPPFPVVAPGVTPAQPAATAAAMIDIANQEDGGDPDRNA
jgi:hypothetical protein